MVTIVTPLPPTAMDCKEPFQYESCGSYCPPTCAEKNPTCDGGCNEGCFCPQDTFLQNGTCVTAEDCLCQVNGTFVDVSNDISKQLTPIYISR